MWGENNNLGSGQQLVSRGNSIIDEFLFVGKYSIIIIKACTLNLKGQCNACHFQFNF